MQQILIKLSRGHDLDAPEAEEAMRTIMAGQATPAQIGAFLMGLRAKGETVEELVGCARAMRAFAVQVQSRHALLVDTCGTGGDGSGTFNISTAAAFVVAGAGQPVAKHGNRAASSRSGSADVLEALGVRIDLAPEVVGRCRDEVGLAFLFAQRHHGAMRHVAGPRRELGFRTIFNLLGPLCNPAGAQAQVVGVPDPKLVEPVAEALRRLGTRRALVVHGSDGLDEFTLGGPSLVADTADGEAAGAREVRPESLGLEPADREALAGGSPQDNADIVLAILRGAGGPRRDVVCLNAAAALVAGGRARDLAEGLELARRSIDGGAALERLEALRRFTTREGEGAAG